MNTHTKMLSLSAIADDNHCEGRRKLRSKSIVTALMAIIAASAMLGQAVAARPAGDKAPVRSCESLTALTLANTVVSSATTVAATTTYPEYCKVQLTVNHPPSNDAVHVGVFLPTSTWNGNFVGTGGAGLSNGDPTTPCGTYPGPCALQVGYANAATDGGGGGGPNVLNPDGTLNWQQINNFGHLGIHTMTTTAKAVISAYYGTGPEYSYFFGGSEGGREALMEAQRYPTDYNGIAAASPAINWTKLVPAQLWPQLVMNWAHDFIPQSKFEAIREEVVAACDELDNVKDGIISDWENCHVDAHALVGLNTPGGAITTTDAEVVNKIWEGPRGPNGEFLWYGLLPGAPFGGPFAPPGLGGLANTATLPDGTVIPLPFPVPLIWFPFWLAQNPSLDWRTITFDQYVQYFSQSVSEFSDVMGADDPDLTAFRDAGGKLVIWHGTADDLVFTQGTVDYYIRVVKTMGGLQQTRQFARLFLAPGANHAGSQFGPAPLLFSTVGTPGSAFAAVVDWVEHHKAPSELLGVTNPALPFGNSYGDLDMTRPLCLYPLVARYKGNGSINDASSFVCNNHF